MSAHLDYEEAPASTVAGAPSSHHTTTATATARDAELEPPPQLPTDTKGYYACRRCRRILVESQWYQVGCLGCQTGPVHRGELAEYATPHFSNFVGLIDPQRSWIARLIGKGAVRGGEPCPNAIYAEAISDDEQEDVDDADEEDAEDGEYEGETADPLRGPARAGGTVDEDLFGF